VLPLLVVAVEEAFSLGQTVELWQHKCWMPEAHIVGDGMEQCAYSVVPDDDMESLTSPQRGL